VVEVPIRRGGDVWESRARSWE
jgi:hypothetical protein